MSDTGRRPRATMRDVAALAGVSLKTVSRVVNRELGVSPEVKVRVEKAVGQLGYRHNLAASNLRRSHGRTAMVGALLQDVSNSFSAALLRSLEDAARNRGTAVLLVSEDLDEVVALSDRILVMFEGRIVFETLGGAGADPYVIGRAMAGHA